MDFTLSNPDFGSLNTEISKQDILRLLETGLKENQSFAKYFADTVLAELQKKLKSLKIQTSAIELDGKSISEDINKKIKTGLQKNVEDVIKKTEDNLKDVAKSSKSEDSKNALNIPSLLGQTPKMSLLTGLKYQKMTRNLLEKIEKGLPEKFNFKEVSLGELFRPVGGGPAALLTPRASLKAYSDWTKIQVDVLNKVKESFKGSEIKFKEISLGDIFRPVGMPFQSLKIFTLFAYNRWMGLQKDIIKNLRDKVQNANFTFEEKITLGSIFGEDNRSSLLSMLKWNKLQNLILKKFKDKTEKGIDDMEMPSIIAKEKSSIIDKESDAPLSAKESTKEKKFESLEEKTPQVEISGFTKEALKNLSEIPGLDRSTEVKVKQEKNESGGLPGWVKALGFAGVALIGGGIWSLASGLFDSGPFKGLKKLLGTLAIKLGGKFVTLFVKLSSKHFAKLFGSIANNLVKVLGKIFPKVASETAKHGGKLGANILKTAAGKLGKFFKPLINKLPLLGTIISFAYAFTRFKTGDILGGVLDLASGIAALIPGIGTALSIGIDVLSAIRDIKTPQEEKVKQGASGGIALFKIVGALALKFGSHMLKFLKKVPLLGSILNFWSSFNRFKSGDILGGILDLSSGLAALIPGIGTALSIGIDVLSAIRDAKTTSEERTKQGASGGIAIFKIVGALALKFGARMLKFLKKVPFLGSILNFWEAYKMFKSNNILKGILNLASGIAGFIPGIGTALSIGIDIINAFIKPKSDTEEKVDEKKESGSKSMWESIKDYFKEKILKVFKRLIFFGKGMKNIFSGEYAEGFTNLANAFSGVHIIGGVFSTIRDWIKQPEETTGQDEQTQTPKKSLMDMIREKAIKKFIDAYKKMPAWLQWTTKKLMPKHVQDLLEKYDKPDDAASVGTLPSEVTLTNPDQMTAEEFEKVKRQLSSDVANDFIWRKGQKIQKFSSKDNIIAVKDENLFGRILTALENKGKEIDNKELINAIKTLEQNMQKMLIQLNNSTISMYTWMQNNYDNKPSYPSITDNPTADLPGIDDKSFDIRDPAWTLRGRAWNRIRNEVW